MLVREVMNADPLTCQAFVPLSEAARLMRANKISGMPVLEDDKLVGVVSESDLLKLLAEGEESQDRQLWLPSPLELLEVPVRDLISWERREARAKGLSSMRVSDVMSRKVQTISPDATIEEAAEAMTRHRINRLPVVEDGKLVGIVTRGDIIAGLGGRS